MSVRSTPKFRIQAFIVTLAGLQAARGLSLIASNNAFINIQYGVGPGNAPPAFGVLGEPDRQASFPSPRWCSWCSRSSPRSCYASSTARYGRYVVAVGGNEKAARLSGIPVGAIKISVYALTGFASAIAGIVHAGQFSFGSPNDGTGYELNAIAAVVIGGTDLFGGAGSMVGTIAGAVMLGALANILQLNDVSAAMQLLATGAIIVVAAALQTFVVGRGGSEAVNACVRLAAAGAAVDQTHVKSFATAFAWDQASARALTPGRHERQEHESSSTNHFTGCRRRSCVRRVGSGRQAASECVRAE